MDGRIIEIVHFPFVLTVHFGLLALLALLSKGLLTPLDVHFRLKDLVRGALLLTGDHDFAKIVILTCDQFQNCN